MLTDFPWDDKYAITDIGRVLTPALVIYPEMMTSNIGQVLRLLEGKADRWRAHIKTAKLAYTLQALLEHGVKTFKCATTLELMTACVNGANDVLVAYPMMGANAFRVRELAEQFKDVRISVLAENEEQMQQWRGTTVGIFLDINPGMNRTGIEQNHKETVVRLAHAIRNSGLEFRGLHYYDGQYGAVEEPRRTAATHSGYDRLLGLVRAIEREGFRVPEIVTAGTPTFPCSLSYKEFQRADFIHRVSPGTIVYCDATSLSQLPQEHGFAAAVTVLTRVVSQPFHGIITCDAGHKAVSADAGVPTCAVIGHPDFVPLSPSEEHLPVQVPEGRGPKLGEGLYLIPRHVCPTVNNFDFALRVRKGRIESVECVSARGRENPLLPELPVSGATCDVALQKR